MRAGGGSADAVHSVETPALSPTPLPRARERGAYTGLDGLQLALSQDTA
ncbi:hypothetical protein CO2235_120043 [Cupriavidus oxalaticus]|uniref:Uncharacterized protein n=1 Tax=Cupriavidus oxalaticus TaxID=96344 RepID=A0A375FUY5_9BURK|nr:hypothetical protein CO2235_120043 [Cupriavidus oxalaticus]